MPSRPVRVQSVLRGPTEASCLQQAVTDGAEAAAAGYVPVWQTWAREGPFFVLTIWYDLAQTAPWTAAAPTPAQAPTTQPIPGWGQSPSASVTPQPVWGQAASGQPGWQGQGQPQPTSPAWSSATQSAPQPTGWQPQQPTAQAAPQPTAWPTQQSTAAPLPPVQQPPISAATKAPTIGGRLVGGIVSIVVIVVVFLVYSALNRALY